MGRIALIFKNINISGKKEAQADSSCIITNINKDLMSGQLVSRQSPIQSKYCFLSLSLHKQIVFLM
ncbi:hypothetical protein [Streptococcus iniae]|uniref:hypothetical protein n=1 Tax=Streptococcus iniae TaxID=1346 RepID=UPI0016052CC9|nr:hypothetical protein [Streptococcus iniae]